MGQYTDEVEDNLLNITNKDDINEAEARGVLQAELWLTELDYPLHITSFFIQDLHKIAFAQVYDWAGKWRTSTPNVGSYIPPSPVKVPQLMYEFADDLQFRMTQTIKTVAESVAELLAFAHHKLVFIHPFTNGNGRTARLLTNALAYNFGYQEVILYYRETNDSRKKYLQAIQLGDMHDLSELTELVLHQLTPLTLY